MSAARGQRADADRALIRAAMEHNQKPQVMNTLYMGSMAIAGLYHTLGLRYGQDGFDAALDAASRPVLDELLAKCRIYIEDMKRK